MGTHPIFESDFDCLTDLSKDLNYKMATAANISKKRKHVAEGVFRAELDGFLPKNSPRTDIRASRCESRPNAPKSSSSPPAPRTFSATRRSASENSPPSSKNASR